MGLTLRIVTRQSPLARWQANFVKEKLMSLFPTLTFEIITLKTQGDKWLATPLQKIGGKGLFVKELEEALLSNRADIAVHSLKDMPASLPEDLTIGAILERESPLDVWVCPKGVNFDQLPKNSSVGTSSLRRTLQLKHYRDDLNFEPLRGNVDTRIKQCLDGKWDAIVLAHAGLKRLNLIEYITEIFHQDKVLPAVGQGALAIECRLNDANILNIIKAINHTPTEICTKAERSFNKKLGGSCQVPIAAFAEIKNDELIIKGRLGHFDGRFLDAQEKGSTNQPESVGEKLADNLLAKGADEWMKQFYEKK